MNYTKASLLFGVVFLITTVWVCIDAKFHRVTTDGNEKYHLGNGSAAWARDCIVLWFAALPWYVIRRKQVLRARVANGTIPTAFASGPVSPSPAVPEAPEKRGGGMVYECEDCEIQLAAGMTACPGCGQTFDVPVPDDIPAKTNELAGFVECALGRPAMFVPSGSFDEVVTFLDGYTQGVIHYAPKVVRADCLDAFGSWLSETQPGLAQVPRHRFWFVKIRALYPADSDALKAAARLYGEFLKDPTRVRQPASLEPSDAAKPADVT